MFTTKPNQIRSYFQGIDKFKRLAKARGSKLNPIQNGCLKCTVNLKLTSRLALIDCRQGWFISCKFNLVFLSPWC